MDKKASKSVYLSIGNIENNFQAILRKINCPLQQSINNLTVFGDLVEDYVPSHLIKELDVLTQTINNYQEKFSKYTSHLLDSFIVLRKKAFS